MADALLVFNIGELVTLAPLAEHQSLPSPRGNEDLGRIKNAWLSIAGGRVHAFGPLPVPAVLAERADLVQIDAEQGLLMPGLVDNHTHPIFAGNRADEFAARLAGTTYQEIAAAGGGIQATVRASRQASDEELRVSCSARLAQFLACGVTTCEVKSGYGLSLDEELRQLRVLQQVKNQSPQELRVTCLGLHAVGPGFSSARAYADELSKSLLPAIASAGLADAVDVFIERGYFAAADCEGFMARARELGLQIRVHADEFSPSGGAAAAARWRALSADHLQHAPAAELQALAAAGVVATILPGTSLYSGLPFVDARRLFAAGCAVAIASDFNPGSCYLGNLPLLASVAGVHCHLTPWQLLAAITLIPAWSLGLQGKKGALAVGYDADFFVHQSGSSDAWLADMGQTAPLSVWIKGEQVR